MMAELNPVPLGRCRGPWRERQHRTVPTIGKSGSRLFASVHFCNTWRCNEPTATRPVASFRARATVPRSRPARHVCTSVVTSSVRFEKVALSPF